MHITESESIYSIDQDIYLSNVEQIPSNGDFSKFASMRMKLAWLSNTKPDKVFEISQTAPVTWAMYENEIAMYCKHLNNAIKYVHDQKASSRIP